MKEKNETEQRKPFELVWSEQLVRSACIWAKSVEDAKARWLKGDSEIWDCPKDWGAEPMRSTLEIRQLGGDVKASCSERDAQCRKVESEKKVRKMDCEKALDAAKASEKTTRRMKLLMQEIRKKLPTLYSQNGKGGKAIAYVKFFTPDSNWTWWVVEGSPVKDKKGKEVDFHFFGLVDGLVKELGYFSLKELEKVRCPMGLPIERDLYWQPKTLDEITPEMFSKSKERGD